MPETRLACRLIPALLTGLGILLPWSQAQALSLGAAATSSRIGAPLRIEIPLLSEDADHIDTSCIRLAGTPAGYADDIPWLKRGTLSIEHGPRGSFLIIQAPPFNQPAIMVGLRVECGVVFRRDYTLLLDPPATEEIRPPIATSHAPTAMTNSPLPAAGSGSWLVQDGDTAYNIAARLAPGSRSKQRELALALLVRNGNKLGYQATIDARLPAGTMLDLPPLPALTVGPLSTRPPRAVAQNITPPAEPRRAPARPPAPAPIPAHDRLVVSGGPELPLRMATSLSARPEASNAQRDQLRTEMQLINALDDKIATQVELKERLRQLEALQARLKDETARVESELNKYTPAAVAIPAPAALASPPAVPHQQPTTENKNPWYASNAILTAGGVGIAVLSALVLVLLRRKRPAEAPETFTEIAETATDEEVVKLAEPLSESDIWPDQAGRPPRLTPRPRKSADATDLFTITGLGQTSALQVVESDIEEHDSAVELADIMLSFGRVHGAAQTLAEFIRSNPKQAVKPWLKLLEVYRIGNMRTEFDALTAQLNRTFNIKAPTWDDFERAHAAPDSLEGFPHIIDKLGDLWGTNVCQTYLHGLLRDNRQGTRRGFPLAAIDDILVLLGVLETQLGPYRPEQAPPENDPLNSQATANAIAEAKTAALTPAADVPPTQAGVPQPSQVAAPALANTTSSMLQRLDFELDMADLSKTLNINLDELPMYTELNHKDPDAT